MSDDATVQFRFATRDDIERIVALDRRYLPAGTIVAEAVFEAWRQSNPETFTCLLSEGTVRGYYSLLPLRNAALGRFVRGELAEKDLSAEDILPAGDASAQAATLYFYSMVLDARYRFLLPRMLQRFVAQVHDPERGRLVREVYATAATDAGRRLLERLGFGYVMAGDQRADGHDLYALDADGVAGLAERVGVTA